MVEVLKTNVTDKKQATILLSEIHFAFTSYKANFDLEDCDQILRIETNFSFIEVKEIINLLSRYGFYAEVLPDDIIEEAAYTKK